MVTTPDLVLPSGKIASEIERAGLVYLAKANDEGPRKVTVVMPFALLKKINLELEKPVFPNGLLIIPTSTISCAWEDFENLLAYYQSALIIVRDTNITALKDKTNLLKGCPLLLRRQVLLQHMEAFKEALTCKDSIMPFVDSILCEGGEFHGRDKGVFLCCRGNVGLDIRWTMKSIEGKPLVIYLHVKHSVLTSTSDTFGHKKLKEWYDAILGSTDDYKAVYDVVSVVVTNKKYNRTWY
ncbi:hypothetical protein BGX27_000067 [Mortierella sp. AM989]|nr:hypothetical protein BGX27_000067 [Mortierella sp. AM989]